MKSPPVFALPEVEVDIRAAVAHYASGRSDLAEYLLRRYNETVGWIAWNPGGGPEAQLTLNLDVSDAAVVVSAAEPALVAGAKVICAVQSGESSNDPLAST